MSPDLDPRWPRLLAAGRAWSATVTRPRSLVPGGVMERLLEAVDAFKADGDYVGVPQATGAEWTLHYTNNDDGIWLKHEDCGALIALDFFPTLEAVADARAAHLSDVCPQVDW